MDFRIQLKEQSEALERSSEVSISRGVKLREVEQQRAKRNPEEKPKPQRKR